MNPGCSAAPGEGKAEARGLWITFEKSTGRNEGLAETAGGCLGRLRALKRDPEQSVSHPQDQGGVLRRRAEVARS